MDTLYLFSDLMNMDAELFDFIATHPDQMTSETNLCVQAILALADD